MLASATVHFSSTTASNVHILHCTMHSTRVRYTCQTYKALLLQSCATIVKSLRCAATSSQHHKTFSAVLLRSEAKAVAGAPTRVARKARVTGSTAVREHADGDKFQILCLCIIQDQLIATASKREWRQNEAKKGRDSSLEV